MLVYELQKILPEEHKIHGKNDVIVVAMVIMTFQYMADVLLLN